MKHEANFIIVIIKYFTLQLQVTIIYFCLKFVELELKYTS